MSTFEPSWLVQSPSVEMKSELLKSWMPDSWLLLLANIISTVTIMSCLFLKVPQIVAVREKKSSEGIHVMAMLMEIIGFTIVALYNYMNNYGYMTYLEYPVILIQVYILMFFVLKYKGLLNNPITITLTCLYWTTILAFVKEVLPKSYLLCAIPLCTPLSGAAKVMYVYGIVKLGRSDNVALSTWMISIITNITRLFTVYIDSGDINLMLNLSISAMLSASVLATTIFYRIKKPYKNRKHEDKKCEFRYKKHICHEHDD